MIIVATTIVAVVAVLFAAMALAPALIETSLPQLPAKPTLRLVEPHLAIESIPQHPEAA